METYVLNLNKYNAFKKFKKSIGHVNQYLITALIGIEKLDTSDIKNQANSHCFATWNPQNIENTKRETKSYILKSTLSWGVSCLDELLLDFFSCFFDKEDKYGKIGDYKVVCRRKTFDENEFDTKMKDCVEVDDKKSKKDNGYISYETIARSVYYKFTLVSSLLKCEIDLDNLRQSSENRNSKGDNRYLPDINLIFAILDLTIQWRNNLIHNDDNILNQRTQQVISHYQKILESNEYGCLDSKKMIERFKENKVPTFKEIAVMIRNLIDFGFVLNAYWVKYADKDKIINEKLKMLIPMSRDEKNYEGKSKKLYDKLHNVEKSKRKKIVVNAAIQEGLYLEKIDSDKQSNEDIVIEKILSNLFEN